MDWNRLKTFYQVAKVGSLSQVARQLNISQSALSRQISSLEERLYTKLFNRTPTGLNLTTKGAKLFSFVEKMFIEAMSAEKSLHDDNDIPSGLLTIYTSFGLASSLGQYSKHFLEQYPKIRLKIVRSDRNFLNIDPSNIDVIIHPMIQNQVNLEQTKLFSLNYKLYASEKYLSKYGMPKTPLDLDKHRLLSYGGHKHVFSALNWILTVGAKEGYIREPYLQDDSNHDLCRYAEEGLGIVNLPTIHFKFHKANLVEVLPQLNGPVCDIYFINPTYLRNVKKVQTYKRFLQKIISNL